MERVRSRIRRGEKLRRGAKCCQTRLDRAVYAEKSVEKRLELVFELLTPPKRRVGGANDVRYGGTRSVWETGTRERELFGGLFERRLREEVVKDGLCGRGPANGLRRPCGLSGLGRVRWMGKTKGGSVLNVALFGFVLLEKIDGGVKGREAISMEKQPARPTPIRCFDSA